MNLRVDTALIILRIRVSAAAHGCDIDYHHFGCQKIDAGYFLLDQTQADLLEIDTSVQKATSDNENVDTV